MKILHLTTHLDQGGITNYIHSLIEPIRKHGCELSVFSSGGDLEPLFTESGAVAYRASIRTKSELHPKLYLAIPKVIRIIRDNRIDMLHAHTRVTQVMAYWIQRMIGIPVVTTCHGFYKKRLGRRLLPAWGDDVIAISAPVGDHLRNDFKVPVSKIRMINNGVNLTEIDALYSSVNPVAQKEKFGFSRNNIVIGVVARLVSDKGHEYLIRAMEELSRRFPNVRLLIVGDGNYRSKLESLVKSLKLDRIVFFAGNVPHKDVMRALGAIDIFSLPATWREGFGLSIVEAMACYKPVIVTNIWSLNSLVQNDVTGILIEPKQVEPLVEGIARLILDPAARNRIGKAARDMTERFFSIPRMADEIYHVYEELAGGSAHQSAQDTD